MTVLALEYRIIEYQILDARFSKHRHATRLRRTDDVRTLARRHVNDV